MGTKHLTEADRLRARTLFFDAGLPKARICQITGFSLNQVKLAIRSKTPKARSGRPPRRRFELAATDVSITPEEATSPTTFMTTALEQQNQQHQQQQLHLQLPILPPITSLQMPLPPTAAATIAQPPPSHTRMWELQVSMPAPAATWSPSFMDDETADADIDGSVGPINCQPPPSGGYCITSSAPQPPPPPVRSGSVLSMLSPTGSASTSASSVSSAAS